MRVPDSVRLTDGSEILVRPIEPADAGKLKEGLRRLSEESRYRRFMGPKPQLSSAELRYLTEVDHHDHEALVALESAGEVVGVARYVRSADAREEAEVAIVVADDWQGRGLGSVLLDRLCDRAVEEGIAHFTATILADNEAVVHLLERLGPLRTRRAHSGDAELQIDLPPAGSRAVLKRALRAAARGDLAVDWRAAVARVTG